MTDAYRTTAYPPGAIKPVALSHYWPLTRHLRDMVNGTNMTLSRGDLDATGFWNGKQYFAGGADKPIFMGESDYLGLLAKGGPYTNEFTNSYAVADKTLAIPNTVNTVLYALMYGVAGDSISITGNAADGCVLSPVTVNLVPDMPVEFSITTSGTAGLVDVTVTGGAPVALQISAFNLAGFVTDAAACPLPILSSNGSPVISDRDDVYADVEADLIKNDCVIVCDVCIPYPIHAGNVAGQYSGIMGAGVWHTFATKYGICYATDTGLLSSKGALHVDHTEAVEVNTPKTCVLRKSSTNGLDLFIAGVKGASQPAYTADVVDTRIYLGKGTGLANENQSANIVRKAGIIGEDLSDEDCIAISKNGLRDYD